jgi:hypothetical protein
LSGVYRLGPFQGRLILTPAVDGRTMVSGVVLRDYGYGSDGIMVDGDLVLEPLRKTVIAPENARGSIDDLTISGILDSPEEYGEVTFARPDIGWSAAEK